MPDYASRGPKAAVVITGSDGAPSLDPFLRADRSATCPDDSEAVVAAPGPFAGQLPSPGEECQGNSQEESVELGKGTGQAVAEGGQVTWNAGVDMVANAAPTELLRPTLDFALGGPATGYTGVHIGMDSEADVSPSPASRPTRMEVMRARTTYRSRLRSILTTEYSRQLRNLLSAQSIPLIALVAVNLLTASLLGPAGKGVASFCITTASLLASIFFLSLFVGSVHAFRSDDPRGVLRGLGGTFAIVVILCGTGAALSLLSIRVGPSYLTPSLDAITLIGMGLLVGSLFCLRAVQGLEHAREYRNLTAIQTGVFVAVVFVLMVGQLTPEQVVIGWSLGNLTGFGAGLWVLHRITGPWRIPKARNKVPVLRASLAAHLGLVGQQALYRADLIILGLLGTASQVGIYALAVSIAELMWVLAEAVSLSTFSRGVLLKTAEERLSALRHDLRIYSLLAVGPLVAVAIMAAPVIHLLLPAYSKAVPAILLLLPGVWFGGRIRIFLSAVVAADRRRAAMVAGLAATLISLIYIPMIKLWGINGAASASSIAYALQSMILTRLLRPQIEGP